MSMSKSRSQIDQWKREQIQERWDRLEPWLRLARRRARAEVSAFNAGVHSPVPQLAYPTFRAMWYAGRYYLGAFRSGCKQETCIDIERIDWHPDATINALTPFLKCSRCGPAAPLPVFTGLWKNPRGQVARTRRFKPLPDDLNRVTKRFQWPYR